MIHAFTDVHESVRTSSLFGRAHGTKVSQTLCVCIYIKICVVLQYTCVQLVACYVHGCSFTIFSI